VRRLLCDTDLGLGGFRCGSPGWARRRYLAGVSLEGGLAVECACCISCFSRWPPARARCVAGEVHGPHGGWIIGLPSQARRAAFLLFSGEPLRVGRHGTALLASAPLCVGVVFGRDERRDHAGIIAIAYYPDRRGVPLGVSLPSYCAGGGQLFRGDGILLNFMLGIHVVIECDPRGWASRRTDFLGFYRGVGAFAIPTLIPGRVAAVAIGVPAEKASLSTHLPGEVFASAT